MRRIASILVLVAVASPVVSPAATSSIEFSNSAIARQLRWPSKRIKVALSESLRNPGANIKLGSDVVGAAQRALSRWSAVTDIEFEVTESKIQSISTPRVGDGITLITVADTPQNNGIFNSNSTTGRTRVFYDEETGEISEADVVINPHPTTAEGLPVQFSTDGTRGTYDLESTLTHELGHLLGLDHSTIIASTMHPHQALNGVYNKPAFTERTLSEEDRTRVRELYGASPGLGAMEGRISQPNSVGQRIPASKAEVWVEENHSGRLIASTLTSSNGSFRIESLPPNSYRVLTRNAALSTTLSNGDADVVLKNSEVGRVEVSTSSSLGAHRYLNPRFVGAEGELSTTPIPVEAGNRLRVYVGGEGVDQISIDGISVTSPFFKVEPGSLQRETFQTPYPVISFEVTTASNAPFGDYSIRLQSKTSEVAYVPGALTIDPGVSSDFANPSDDPRFFVRQHYRDLLGRDADAAGLEYWSGQLEQCGADVACLNARRLKISTAFLNEPEFQQKSGFVHRIYRVALGRVPLFSEFETARAEFAQSKDGLDPTKRIIAISLIDSEEFRKRYPTAMSAEEFVDAVLAGIRDTIGVNLISRRADLVAMLDHPTQGRAMVIQAIADDSELIDAEHERAFVLMQYFGYYQRDPDEADFKVWLIALNSKRRNDPARFTEVSCAFVNSAEYQARFGMALTHNPAECGKQQ